MMGAYTGEKEVDERSKTLAAGKKARVEEHTGKTYTMFEVVAVKTQVVAGTNHKMKIQVADEEYIHIIIFEPLAHTQEPPSLTNVLEGKTRTDPLQ